MPITASPETSGRYSRCIEPLSVTGARCCVAAAGLAVACPGGPSTRSNSVHRCCDPNCASHTGSCRHSRCCESTTEERGAVNPLATFCGNRGRATASGDPVACDETHVPTATYVPRIACCRCSGPNLMLWTAPPPARECHRGGCC